MGVCENGCDEALILAGLREENERKKVIIRGESERKRYEMENEGKEEMEL